MKQPSIIQLLKAQSNLSQSDKELVLFILRKIAAGTVRHYRAFIQIEEYFTRQDELSYEWDMERYNFYNGQG